MTQEEKQILSKDLCGRLPYGIKVWYLNGNGAISTVKGIVGDICYFNENPIYDNFCHIETVKPYLRPMSSMTEEENAIFNNISNKDRGYEEDEDGWVRCDSIHTKWGVWPDGCAKLLDYLNSIHIDYRGLIPMGLALEATEGMYKTE